MTCRELIDFLMAYLDGELPPARRAVFDEHLEICEACQRYLESYRATISLGQAACAEDDAVPEDVPEELVQAVLAARTTRDA